MKNADRQDPLFNEVFSEDHELRAIMLRKTLTILKRKRQRLMVGKAAALLGAAILLCFWIFSPNGRKVDQQSVIIGAKLSTKPYELVITKPFNPDLITATKPFEPSFTPINRAFAILRTIPGQYQMVRDGQLMALAGNRPTFLVQIDENSKRFIFLDELKVTEAPLK